MYGLGLWVQGNAGNLGLLGPLGQVEQRQCNHVCWYRTGRGHAGVEAGESVGARRAARAAAAAALGFRV